MALAWSKGEPPLGRSTDLGKSEDPVAVVNYRILWAKKVTDFSECLSTPGTSEPKEAGDGVAGCPRGAPNLRDS